VGTQRGEEVGKRRRKWGCWKKKKIEKRIKIKIIG
jgi:hypothetical protein